MIAEVMLVFIVSISNAEIHEFFPIFLKIRQSSLNDDTYVSVLERRLIEQTFNIKGGEKANPI